MIRHARVVDETRPERPLARSFREKRLIGASNRAHDLRQGLRDGLGYIPAVGTRIAEELPLLVEALREREGPLGREAVEPIRMALELRQIVELGRRDLPDLPLDRRDPPLPGFGALDDSRSFLAVGRKPPPLHLLGE